MSFIVLSSICPFLGFIVLEFAQLDIVLKNVFLNSQGLRETFSSFPLRLRKERQLIASAAAVSEGPARLQAQEEQVNLNSAFFFSSSSSDSESRLGYEQSRTWACRFHNGPEGAACICPLGRIHWAQALFPTCLRFSGVPGEGRWPLHVPLHLEVGAFHPRIPASRFHPRSQ
jgi:hypothetical protein